MKTDWMDVLDEPGQLTLFAPTDESFEKLDPDFQEILLEAGPLHLGSECIE